MRMNRLLTGPYIDGADGLLSRRTQCALRGAQALGLPHPVVIGLWDVSTLGHDVQEPVELLKRRTGRGDLGEQGGGGHCDLLGRVQRPGVLQRGREPFGCFGPRDRQSDGLAGVLGAVLGEQAHFLAHGVDQAPVVRLLVAAPQRLLCLGRLRHRSHPRLLVFGHCCRPPQRAGAMRVTPAASECSGCGRSARAVRAAATEKSAPISSPARRRAVPLRHRRGLCAGSGRGRCRCGGRRRPGG